MTIASKGTFQILTIVINKMFWTIYIDGIIDFAVKNFDLL